VRLSRLSCSQPRTVSYGSRSGRCDLLTRLVLVALVLLFILKSARSGLDLLTTKPQRPNLDSLRTAPYRGRSGGVRCGTRSWEESCHASTVMDGPRRRSLIRYATRRRFFCFNFRADMNRNAVIQGPGSTYSAGSDVCSETSKTSECKNTSQRTSKPLFTYAEGNYP
jgi:hypothetical protein